MISTESIASDKSVDKGKIEQDSIDQKDTTTHRRTDIKIVQNFLLIWLDKNIDNNDEFYQNAIVQLRCVNSTINTFTDTDQCVDFITDIYDGNVLMIISDSLCREIVPLIHDIAQLNTVLLLCKDQTSHEPWAKGWPKLKNMCTTISQVCEALKLAVQQCERNTISMSFVATDDNTYYKNLDRLDPTFMYTQIMKEILLSIKFEQHHFEQFINYCRTIFDNNEGLLKNVDKLEKKYHDTTAILWYTREGFLYSMLNRALRIIDVDIIIKMAFFMNDLHGHIEELHRQQFSGHQTDKMFTVYRGQGMSKTDLDRLINTKNGLMSFNNFLSTSKDRDVSLAFAESNQSDPDLVGILFVMTIDPSKSTTPFASINDVSHFQEEDEVLFSMHTVFRIHDIKLMNENHRLFQVDLIITDDNDQDLRALTDRIREETFPDEEGWYRLGLVLRKMGRVNSSQQVYEVMLSQATDESTKGKIYSQLGSTSFLRTEYKDAITFYEKSLEIYKNILPSNHPNLAISYLNIGNVYNDMQEYSKAASSYIKSLEIQKQSSVLNDTCLFNAYNNIGELYHRTGDYSLALYYHQKCLESYQQSLPSNHPDLASSYNNIGSVYGKMGEYSKALSFYGKALEIKKQSLPPNHPDLATSYSSIGNVHLQTGKYQKALLSYEKALKIQQESLPPNRLELANSYNNIGEVYRYMDEYTKALSYHEQAVAIRQQSLPPNHPCLATSYNNIGLIYYSMGDYSKALSSHEKALQIRQQSLSSYHPDLAASYNNIGTVYIDMGEYSKALLSHEKSLEIKQQSLPPSHPDLAKTYNNIGIVYSKISENTKALFCYKKALEIKQQSLPPKHPDLASTYENIGIVHSEMGEYWEALSSYEKALEINQQLLPPNHPRLSYLYIKISNMYENMGFFTEARSYDELGTNILEQALLSNHPYLQVLISKLKDS